MGRDGQGEKLTHDWVVPEVSADPRYPEILLGRGRPSAQTKGQVMTPTLVLLSGFEAIARRLQLTYFMVVFSL